jgi:hypothetical protein
MMSTIFFDLILDSDGISIDRAIMDTPTNFPTSFHLKQPTQPYSVICSLPEGNRFVNVIRYCHSLSSIQFFHKFFLPFVPLVQKLPPTTKQKTHLKKPPAFSHQNSSFQDDSQEISNFSFGSLFIW